MEERQRRSFTDDYKRQAVDLVASSGRSIGSVAKGLGLRDSVLRRWVEQRGASVAALAGPATQRVSYRLIWWRMRQRTSTVGQITSLAGT
jgi:transposase-like protein